MSPLIARHGPELELMFRCARLEVDGANLARIGDLLQDGLAWPAFLQTLERAHVAPLVSRTFQAMEHPALPRQVSETVRVRSKITSWMNQRFAEELAALDLDLHNEGLQVLHYKGATAAVRLYGDVRLRSFNDCDFLVRRHELHRVLATMERRGYRPAVELNAAEQEFSEKEFKEYLYLRGDFHIEPHWSLTARRYPFDISYPELWARAGRFRLEGRELSVLDPEDDLLVLCMAAGKGCWKRYQMVTDIVQSIHINPELDWQRFFERARAAGAGRIVLLSAMLAAELGGASVPEQVLERGRSSAAVRKLASRVAHSFEGPVPTRRWLPQGPQIIRRDLLAMRERPRDRLRYLWRTTTTPTIDHHRLFRLPRGLRWLYPVLVPAFDYLAFPLYSIVKHRAPLAVTRWKSAALKRTQAPADDP